MPELNNRILVIEDDPDFRAMMCLALESDGFEVIPAENGRVGVALAIDAMPSIILCDVRMPELDGHDTLTQLRTLPTTKDIPFVFLSGGADMKDVRRGMNLGADDYLVKPFTPEELIDTVRARLQRHSERPANTPPGSMNPTMPLPIELMGAAHATVAGRYELLRRIAEGGMGSVYHARDKDNGQDVAVKLIVRTATSNDRFLRECEALAGMHHPRVVPYRAHGDAGEGFHYLVMDWLQGIDLSKRLQRGPLSVDETMRMIRHTGEALAHVHRSGVVHRDVKPGNLFLVRDDIDALTLIDFGLARGTDSAPVTQTGTLLGTPGYLAPEQVKDGFTPDARCDVFAAGCVAYECLVGVSPFHGPTPMASIARLMLEESPRVRTARPEVPEALDEIIAAMMRRERGGRLRDGAAILDALTSAGL
ncbi:MAG: protein kinase [Deltaproteobacteria bacterium]|nr:protein kinase [Myxococcales bacterium]MDP3213803.1 protein kinase [Deltaproteobacteria bacterium]